MTTEEKLDKLTERVDSLAHSVELLAGMQIETENHLNRFIDTINNGLVRFANILSNHEDRIEGLEGKQPEQSVPGRYGPRSIFRRKMFSMLSKDLLEILVCPDCKTALEYRRNPERLKCTQCHRVYAVKDDIPIMLVDEATTEP